MRALVMTTSYPLDSKTLSGRFLRDLLLGLGERGWRFTVVTPGSYSNLNPLEDSAIQLEPVDYPGGRSHGGLAHKSGIPEEISRNPWKLALVPGLLASMRARALDVIRRERIDLLWSHWILPSGYLCDRIARKHSIPHLNTVHGTDVDILERLGKWPGLCWLAERQTRHTVVSAPAAATARRISRVLGGRGIETIPLPAGDSQVQAARRNRTRIRILYLGRFEKIKGPDLLLRAASAFNPGLVDEIVLAGSGSLERELRVLAPRVPIPVRFAGVVSGEEKQELITSATALVLPSRIRRNGRMEGLPHAAMEALVRGVPVFAPRETALGESLSSTMAEYLFTGDTTDENRISSLATAINSALCCDRQRRTVFERAQEVGFPYDRSRSLSAWDRRLSQVAEAGDQCTIIESRW